MFVTFQNILHTQFWESLSPAYLEFSHFSQIYPKSLGWSIKTFKNLPFSVAGWVILVEGSVTRQFLAEKSADELWLGVKCHSNPELAGSPRTNDVST
jgi:hypothetical protein